MQRGMGGSGWTSSCGPWRAGWRWAKTKTTGKMTCEMDVEDFFPQQRELIGSSAQNSSGVLWCRARSGSTGFRTRFRRRSASLWCRARSGSTGFRRRFRRRFQEALVQSRVRFNGVRRRLQSRSRRRFWESLVQGQVRTGFPALGFAARFRKISKNKTLRLLGIPPKLIF